MPHSIVYFIQAKDGGAIKIGFSRQLTKRLRDLTMIIGRELRVLAVMDGDHSTESRLHKKFKHLRIAGEWFEPGADLTAFIAREGRPWEGGDRLPPDRQPLRSRRIRDAKILIDRDIDILVLATCGRRRAEIARAYRITPSMVYRCLRQIPLEVKNHVAHLASQGTGVTIFVLADSERAVLKKMIADSVIV